MLLVLNGRYLNQVFHLKKRIIHLIKAQNLEGFYLMTPSEQAKKAGLESLAEVSRISSVKLQTLHNWHRNKPRLFRIVLFGCAKWKGKYHVENKTI